MALRKIDTQILMSIIRLIKRFNKRNRIEENNTEFIFGAITNYFENETNEPG